MFSRRSSSSGLTTKLPSTLPMRTAPTGVGQRDVGDHQRGGGAVHREDVVRVDVVDRERDRDELRLVAPALGEERADRAVDHARGQRALLARAALALEERAGDLARGVHALLDVDRQREEVDVAEVAGRGGAEDHRVALADDDGAGGLLGHLAGLERDLGTGDLDGDRRNGVCHMCFLSWPARRSAGHRRISSVSERDHRSERACERARAWRSRRRRRVGVVVTPARSASEVAPDALARTAASERRSASKRSTSRPSARRAPTGAGPRGGPGRRRARRASPRTRPAARPPRPRRPPPRRAGASTARGKWRKHDADAQRRAAAACGAAQ